MLLRACHHGDAAARLGDQRALAVWTERGLAFVAQFLEQFLIALMRPLFFARVLDVAQLVPQPILFIHRTYIISLISLPLRAFSTVSSNLPPRSAPISLARFLAH